MRRVGVKREELAVAVGELGVGVGDEANRGGDVDVGVEGPERIVEVEDD